MSVGHISDAIEAARSYSGDGIVSTTYLDDYIVRGNVFSIQIVQSFTAATAIKFYADLSSVSSGQAVFLLPLQITISAGYVTVEVFEDPEGVSGGSALSLVNRNFTSTTTAESVVTGGVTTTSDGTAIGLKELFGAAGGAGPTNPGGGLGNSTNSLILDASKNYLWVLTPSSDAEVGIVAEFAEIACE